MPQRSINIRTSIAQTKISLGHRARTHYKSMLANPSSKLQPFLFPGMNVEQLKSLAKVLTKADPKQRTQLKKDASKKRQEAKEQTEQRKLMLADIERTSRRLARSRQFEEPSQTTFTIGHIGDKFMGPSPEYCILTIMKKFPGKKIRIVAYNGTNGEEVRLLTKQIDRVSNTCMLVNVNFGDGPMVRDVYHKKDGDWIPTASDHAQPGRGDHTYSVPKEKINKYFRDNEGSTFYSWTIQYPTYWIEPGNPIPFLNPGDTIKVFIVDRVKPLPTHRNQSFAQGISHCLLQPIIQDLTDKKYVAKSKQSKSNYNCGIKVLSQYEEEFRAGIPEEMLSQLVEEVSKKVHINIEITVPLAINQFINVRNSSGHGKTYRFINTRLDHVDLNSITLQNIQSQGRHRTFEILDVSREEILDIQKQHLESKTHIEWLCDKSGITKLWSTTQVWKCNLHYSDTVANFEEDAGLHRLMIDHVNDKDMSEFILAATHYCCSVQFQTPPEDLTGIKCSDIHKSYARPQDCRFYEECKLPNKLTRLAPTDSVQGPGLYLINNIDWSKATSKFVELMQKEGNPIRDNNIYAVPILKLLDYHNVKYLIVIGCWAGGRVNTYDLNFSDTIIQNKYYPMLVGKWNQIRDTNSYYMRGSQEMAGHMLRYAPNAEAEWCAPIHAWDPPEGVINIRYPKQHIWHLSQFTAYINAYEFVKMADQLMCCDLGQVIQIQKDDFMHYDHEFELQHYFRDKTPEIEEVDDTGSSKAERKVKSATPNQIDLSDQFDDFTFVAEQQCYLNAILEFHPECVSRILASCVAHDMRNSHITKIIAPVVAHEGPGGTGKTDEALRDPRRQRVIYISPSHKLSRAKAREYNLCSEGDQILKEIEDKLAGLRKGDRKTLTNIKDEMKLQVTVWRRMLNENPEIWKKIDRYANNLIIDEVSMMWTETAQFIMERFPNHEIVFAGDSGFQLPAFKTKGDKGPQNPFSSAKLNIPVIEFNKIFRVTCDKQLEIRHEGREMIKQNKSIAEIEAFYMSKYQIVTSKEEVVLLYEAFSCENGIYQPKDLIICSTNEACNEWTELLAPLQPSDESGRIQKYHLRETDRDHTNGEIVVSANLAEHLRWYKKDGETLSTIAHAFTAHSTIGETAAGKVFIDRRRMWEIEHWETIVGRARRAEDIIIIDIPDTPPSKKYSKNINYIISSEKGKIAYIGSTTEGIETRKRGHESDKRCMSRKVMKYDDWKMEIIEEYPCASKKEAEAREHYWIQKTPNCVNKNLLTASVGPYSETRIEYIDGSNLRSLIDELNKYSINKSTKPRKSMSNEERELDNIRLFKNYVLTLQKKVEINDKGESFIKVTYTRKSCGGRRYSIGDFTDEMGSAKKISYSLQGMYGILRRFLIGKWCHDIDIVNCIPTVLIQIAEEDRVPMKFRETLGYYIMRRQECLEEIMEHHGCSKEDAKDAVIRTYNGGTFKKWAEDCEITLNALEPATFLEDLNEEIKGMKAHMLALPKYKTIRSACLRLKPDKSIDQEASDRSAFATICFKREDEILHSIEESVVNDGWRTETLIYDGLPLYDRQMSLEPSMRRAEAHVLQKTGIYIELAEKPMYQENLTVENVLSHIRNR